MKANELRIGNLITAKGILFELSTIEEDGCIGTLLNPQQEPDYNRGLEPIPLTEEWLVKMGFIMHEGNNFQRYWIAGEYYSGVFELTFRPIPEELTFCFTPRATDNRTDLVIRHVHSLQNLYFALTGEELTIKE